ncbi:hypothetical protein GCM10008905_29600 [Clostridium malenominatum]|uniref:Uncharacterized protein n=1 Tax=Clostridium malenominatum TaxID=1539 RepID=A0ABP3UEH9_9CLOT
MNKKFKFNKNEILPTFLVIVFIFWFFILEKTKEPKLLIITGIFLTIASFIGIIRWMLKGEIKKVALKNISFFILTLMVPIITALYIKSLRVETIKESIKISKLIMLMYLQ